MRMLRGSEQHHVRPQPRLWSDMMAIHVALVHATMVTFIIQSFGQWP